MKGPYPFKAQAKGAGRPAFAAILFAEDFDDPPAPPQHEQELEPEVLEPVFSLGELEAVRREAHASGVAAGMALTEDAHRQAVRVATQTVGEMLAESRGEAARAVDASAEALARTLLATLCAALPALCARHGEAELRDIVRALLPSLVHEPWVTVRVHPSLIDPLAAELHTLGAELAGLVMLTPMDAMLPGDVRIAWQHGSASRDTRSILGEIDDALGTIGLREAPPRAARHLADRGGRPVPDQPAHSPIEELAHVG